MAFEVEFTDKALRDMGKLPPEARRRVGRALACLADDPQPSGVTALSGALRGYCRIRIGVHRAVYSVDSGKLVVLVVLAGHRRDVYQLAVRGLT